MSGNPLAQARPPAQAQINGFTLAEGVHPQGSRLPWHTHDGPTICFVMRGGFMEGFHGRSLTCEPAMVKFTPAGEPHFNRFDWSDTRGLLIEVAPARARELSPRAPILEQLVHFKGGLPAALALRVHRELQASDASAALAMEGLLLELIAHADRGRLPEPGRRPPAFVIQARDLLHESLGYGIGLSELAARVEAHPVTLARAFRRAYGCSVGEYLRRLRLERATHQLTATDLPLARIAAEAGFADQSHFSNLFRRRTGLSPSRYRRALRQ